METSNRPADLDSQRIDYLDNLRAVAMLLGVYFHAGLAYAETARTVWLATNPHGSVAVDASLWFIHLFRMSLFFLLAGYFAQLVCQRKGIRHFLVGRFWRIAMPLLLFYPGLLVALSIVIGFALAYLPEPEGLMALIAAEARKPIEERRPPHIGTMHLWFLYYLLGFVLASITGRFVWGFLRRSAVTPGTPRFVAQTAGWMGSWGILFLGPLLLVPAANVAGSPLPAPESFVPHWWPFAFYGLFYAAGGWLYRRESWLVTWERHLGWLVIVCGLGFWIYYVTLPELEIDSLDAGPVQVFGQRRVGSAVLTAYLSAWLTLLAIVVGRRFLATRNGLLSFISDSAYWVYLVHLPLVLFWQTFLIPLPWPLGIKMAIVLLGTTIPSLLTYVVFVRYTPIGWLLHGKRQFP